MAATPPERIRRSAAERRTEIVAIALRHFAEGGYNGTSTESIASEVGLSQPYLFRLFGTKRELFLACHAEMHARIQAAFVAAVDGVAPEERFAAMGQAYMALLADRTTLLMQMQSYAACSDPVIRDRVRDAYRSLVAEVKDLTQGTDAEVWTFFSHGMLLNVVASLDLHAVADEDPWARAWTDPFNLVTVAAPEA